MSGIAKRLAQKLSQAAACPGCGHHTEPSGCRCPRADCPPFGSQAHLDRLNQAHGRKH